MQFMDWNHLAMEFMHTLYITKSTVITNKLLCMKNEPAFASVFMTLWLLYPSLPTHKV